jgi:hypothetical protein
VCHDVHGMHMACTRHDHALLAHCCCCMHVPCAGLVLACCPRAWLCPPCAMLYVTCARADACITN